VARRYLSYATAPLLPLGLVAVLVLAMIAFGLLHMIPVFGDIVIDGLLWGVMLALGLVMAGVLVGLITWPLMTATISAEDEESLNAVARAYSYVVQAPWHYIWYTLVALAYGAVVVFFVNFMGSMAVYLAEWGVSQNPAIRMAGREPHFLFVYAPTSYHWRELLLQGATVEGQPVVEQGQINPATYKRYLWGAWENPAPRDSMAIWNHIGAGLVALWLGAFFLLILGFGYSYFWSATTIIYLLMRKQVDDAELDEVYFEEDEQEDYFAAPSAAPKPAPAQPPPPPSPGLTMVEPPALRTPAPPPPPTPTATPAAPPTATPAAPPAPTRTEAPPDDGNGNPPA